MAIQVCVYRQLLYLQNTELLFPTLQDTYKTIFKFYLEWESLFQKLNSKSMELKTSQRKSAKIRLSLQGPAGSGKSLSSLKIAFGMTNDWNKITVIDTERGSANLYSHLGPYYVLDLEEPFTPERYIEAIKLCEQNSIDVIIIDGLSMEWAGKGGILEIHEKTTSSMRVPNSFTAWASVTPRHQAFIDAILQSKCHVITTIRTKTEYVISERNGKNVPQKVGMAAVQRDGFEYEVSISLDIDEEHMALSSKDRTGLFSDIGKFRITTETGKLIRDWCNSGTPSQSPLIAIPLSVQVIEAISSKIKKATSIERLNEIYQTHQKEWTQQLSADYTTRKRELLLTNISNIQNFGKNGTPIGTT